VNEKEIEKLGERVENELTKLSTHQRRDAGKQVLHDLRRVGVVGRNQMKPELTVVEKQLRTRRNPSRTERQTSSVLANHDNPLGHRFTTFSTVWYAIVSVVESLHKWHPLSIFDP